MSTQKRPYNHLDLLSQVLEESKDLPPDLESAIRVQVDGVAHLEDGGVYVRCLTVPVADTEVEDAPKGVTSIPHYCEDEPWVYHTWKIHTLDAPYCVANRHRVVVSIRGVTYMVHYLERGAVLHGHGGENPFSDGLSLYFKPVSDPPTPKVRRGGIQIFGQPQFNQGGCFPIHNGEVAYILYSWPSGWGDSGQANLFIALDDQGVPCRAWYEHSCC